MKRHIIETLLHEAVKVSRLEDIKGQPLMDLVHTSLEHAYESGTLTQAENEALQFLRRLKDPKFQQDLVATIKRLDDIIKRHG